MNSRARSPRSVAARRPWWVMTTSPFFCCVHANPSGAGTEPVCLLVALSASNIESDVVGAEELDEHRHLTSRCGQVSSAG